MMPAEIRPNSAIFSLNARRSRNSSPVRAVFDAASKMLFFMADPEKIPLQENITT
jgi:hypothetical protein